PDPADLEEPPGGSLLAQTELLGDTAAAVVARHDRRLHTVQAERFEPVADDQHHTLGYVAVPGVLGVHPVPDEARLERSAHHAAEADLADKRAVVEEQPEPVRRIELALTLPRAAAAAERLAIMHGVGRVRLGQRLPRLYPV